jgi:SAM-dependent methyltransferase|tara:strand:- start:103311 stop:103949 length:639 start_codon:yes stop_codon:yes gene_type:complete
MAAQYDDARFRKESVPELAQIILTGNTQARWEKETPIFAKKIVEHMQIVATSTVLDFGVGIGRLAKEILKLTNCTVIGVDISKDMLRESINYVSHPNYIPMSINAFKKMRMENKLQIDCAYGVWVLQHCMNYHELHQLIRDALPDKGTFFVANTTQRWLPIEGPEPWGNDGLNIRDALLEDFKLGHDLTTELLDYLPEGYEGQYFCHNFIKK